MYVCVFTYMWSPEVDTSVFINRSPSDFFSIIYYFACMGVLPECLPLHRVHALEPLEMELQAVGAAKWVLGLEPGYPRTVSAPNSQITETVPTVPPSRFLRQGLTLKVAKLVGPMVSSRNLPAPAPSALPL